MENVPAEKTRRVSFFEVALEALAALAGFLGLARRGTGTSVTRTAPGGALYRLTGGDAQRDGALELTAAQREATFTFDASVASPETSVEASSGASVGASFEPSLTVTSGRFTSREASRS